MICNVRKQRFTLACEFIQSDQNFHWAHLGLPRMQSFFMLSMKIISDSVEVQLDLSYCCAHMAEGTFSLTVTHIAFSTIFSIYL